MLPAVYPETEEETEDGADDPLRNHEVPPAAREPVPLSAHDGERRDPLGLAEDLRLDRGDLLVDGHA
jgi:hypothetical protein